MINAKIYPKYDNFFRNVDDAVSFLKENDYCCNITLGAVKYRDLYRMTGVINRHVIDYNIGKLLNEQILPTNPYIFNGILGCLSLYCAEIDFDTYEKNRGIFAPFSGWNIGVLDRKSAKNEN